MYETDCSKRKLVEKSSPLCVEGREARDEGEEVQEITVGFFLLTESNLSRTRVVQTYMLKP